MASELLPFVQSFSFLVVIIVECTANCTFLCVRQSQMRRQFLPHGKVVCSDSGNVFIADLSVQHGIAHTSTARVTPRKNKNRRTARGL